MTQLKQNSQFGLPIVAVSGVLDLSTACQILELMEGPAGGRSDRLVLDLSAVSCLDVQAARLLLTGQQQMLSGGFRLGLLDPSPAARLAFDRASANL